MGKRTILSVENGTVIASGVMAVFSTPAAGTAGANVEITRLEISQRGTTTLQQIGARFATRDNAGTLTVTSKAPTAVQPIGGAASAFTGNTNAIGGTARSGVMASTDSGGTYTEILPFDFPNLNGYLWKPDRDEQLIVPPSQFFVVQLLMTPTTLTGWTISLYLDEK